NTFTVKNFEVLLDIQYTYVDDVLFGSKHSAVVSTEIANSFKTILNAWTPENQETNIAQVRPLTARYNTNNDSDRVQDGSFVRGRNLMLSYNFLAQTVEKMNVSRMTAYVSVQNFFLATKYDGYD